MQRKPKSELEEVAPSVPFVMLASWFGFPGAGHVMLGKKALGITFLALFSLGFLGGVFDLSATVPQIANSLLEGEFQLPTATFSLRLLGWLALAGSAWGLSGLHAGVLAYQQAKNRRPSDIAAVLGS